MTHYLISMAGIIDAGILSAYVQKSMDKVNSLGKETERLLKEQVLRLIKY